jgi:hypothetical protein
MESETLGIQINFPPLAHSREVSFHNLEAVVEDKEIKNPQMLRFHK